MMTIVLLLLLVVSFFLGLPSLFIVGLIFGIMVLLML
jgi:hypothetical protein